MYNTCILPGQEVERNRYSDEQLPTLDLRFCFQSATYMPVKKIKTDIND